MLAKLPTDVMYPCAGVIIVPIMLAARIFPSDKLAGITLAVSIVELGDGVRLLNNL